MQVLLRMAAALLATMMASGAAAADPAYLARPMKIMVGANAGGGTDIIARMLAEKFQEALKQPFVGRAAHLCFVAL